MVPRVTLAARVQKQMPALLCHMRRDFDVTTAPWQCKWTFARRSYMSGRDRPSHSRMFDKDGNVIPIKDDASSYVPSFLGLTLAVGLAFGAYRSFSVESLSQFKEDATVTED
eukprot:CAMPEP_0198147702 /NCGR_PEP_ID=MMETSP1443-20131203/37353_1 /TAXON_ID=186043 /ORGANISM="Entomoneis sp., Strain CCMP2396" /LENGTH=111 /DNA_ID=CAMNT_0043812141 /DNA_START=11 /DNA_END=346 /DNA_ORIENTATION=+